jgi:hypothetical protein
VDLQEQKESFHFIVLIFYKMASSCSRDLDNEQRRMTYSFPSDLNMGNRGYFEVNKAL